MLDQSSLKLSATYRSRDCLRIYNDWEGKQQLLYMTNQQQNITNMIAKMKERQIGDQEPRCSKNKKKFRVLEMLRCQDVTNKSKNDQWGRSQREQTNASFQADSNQMSALYSRNQSDFGEVKKSIYQSSLNISKGSVTTFTHYSSTRSGKVQNQGKRSCKKNRSKAKQQTLDKYFPEYHPGNFHKPAKPVIKQQQLTLNNFWLKPK